MKIRNTAAVVAAIATVVTIQSAQAAFTDNLADLIAGGSLSIGDKTFSGFTAHMDGLTSYNPINISVTASQVGDNYYLTWGGNISLASAAGTTVSGDLLLGYTVTASAGVIVAIDQTYTGFGQNTVGVTPGGTFISVAENVYAPNSITSLAHSFLTEAVTGTDFTAVGAILPVGQPSVNVTKDIGFAATDGGFVTISQVIQSFDQVAVPEPATVVAGALLLLPLGASTLRILRNRKQ
jgi:hypothetical protein